MSAPMAEVEAELRALEEGTLDPAAFPHREHLRLGFEMLRRHSFAEAAVRFARGLRRVVTKAGRPEVYNETITIAFLALIGERMGQERDLGWEQFISQNVDLTDKTILQRWYGSAELKSDLARATFILPRPIALTR